MGFKFRNKLLKKIAKILRDYSKAACELTRVEWSKLDAEGNADINFKVEDAEAVVVATIYAHGQKAWILEYGRGSAMEKSQEENPFLEEYLQSSYFNPERLKRGLSILGRPKGSYLDLDDKYHFTTGAIKNWNLELLAPSVKHLQVDPLPPRRIIKRVLFGQNNDGIIAEIDKEILKAVAEIAFEMFAKIPNKITIHKE